MPPRDPILALSGRTPTGAPSDVWLGSVTQAPAGTDVLLSATSRDLDAAVRSLRVRGWTPALHPSGALLLPASGDAIAVEFDAVGDAWCIGWEPASWPVDPGVTGAPGPTGPAGLAHRGAWNAATAYSVNDSVVHLGSSYRRKVAGTTGTAPAGDATNWELYAAKGDTGTTGATGPAGVAGSGPPVGMLSDYAGSTAPSLWLLCAGQEVSRTTYASLFDVIATTYGAGDGSTTFNVPDLRGRVAVALDNMGGTDAGRLAAANTLGGAGGAETHTLTAAQSGSPAHSHPPGLAGGSPAVGFITYGSPGANIAFPPGGTQMGGANSGTGNNTAANASGAHNNMQPFMLVNKIIYTGV